MDIKKLKLESSRNNAVQKEFHYFYVTAGTQRPGTSARCTRDRREQQHRRETR